MHTLETVNQVGTAEAPGDSGAAQVESRRAVPDRLRQDLVLLMCRGEDLSRKGLERHDSALAHVSSEASQCHAFLEEQLLSAEQQGELFPLARLATVLEITVRRDRRGAVRLVRRLLARTELALTVYDMVEDKYRLFELLSGERAQTVNQLFRNRRAALDLLTKLEGCAQQPRAQGDMREEIDRPPHDVAAGEAPHHRMGFER